MSAELTSAILPDSGQSNPTAKKYRPLNKNDKLWHIILMVNILSRKLK